MTEAAKFFDGVVAEMDSTECKRYALAKKIKAALIAAENAANLDIQITDGVDGWTHVIGVSDADSAAKCLEAVTIALREAAAGKYTVIRAKPKAESQKNFMYNRWEHRGYVRRYCTSRSQALDDGSAP